MTKIVVKRLSIKNHYTLVHALFWMTNSIVQGFAAIYLLHKGLSNALAGLIIGGASFIALLIQPLITQLTEKISFLSTKRMIQILMIIQGLFYVLMSVGKMPVFGIEIIYLLLYATNWCIPTLISTMGMEYLNQGKYIDFGLSRGIGSLTTALTAVTLGKAVERYQADILGYIYIILVILFLLVFSSIADSKHNTSVNTVQKSKTKSSNDFLHSVLKKPVFLCMMIAYFLIHIGHMCITTYMVNIVRGLGGTESTFGVISAISTLSELPFMILAGTLLRKKCSCSKLLKISALFYALKSLLVMYAGNLFMVLIGYLFNGLAWGFFTTLSVYYVNDTMEQEHRAKGQALFQIVTTGTACGLGSLLGGWMIDAYGMQGMMTGSLILTSAGFLISLMGYEKKKSIV